MMRGVDLESKARPGTKDRKEESHCSVVGYRVTKFRLHSCLGGWASTCKLANALLSCLRQPDVTAIASEGGRVTCQAFTACKLAERVSDSIYFVALWDATEQ